MLFVKHYFTKTKVTWIPQISNRHIHTHSHVHILSIQSFMLKESEREREKAVTKPFWLTQLHGMNTYSQASVLFIQKHSLQFSLQPIVCVCVCCEKKTLENCCSICAQQHICNDSQYLKVSKLHLYGEHWNGYEKPLGNTTQSTQQQQKRTEKTRKMANFSNHFSLVCMWVSTRFAKNKHWIDVHSFCSTPMT